DLMNAASTGDAAGDKLRGQLLDPANCWKQAHDLVEGKLKNIVPFGFEHTVIFYEPENCVDAPFLKSGVPKYPNNHCLHILYLPERGTATVDAQGLVHGPAQFGQNLKCCYQPW